MIITESYGCDRHGEDAYQGCACAAAGARLCYLIRYDVGPADDEMDDGTCECSCHHWSECDE